MRIKSINPKKPLIGTKISVEKNEHLFSGCAHDCKYCYAKATAIQHKKNTTDDWKNEVVKNRSLFKKKCQKIESTIMFPSTHDITPKNLVQNLICLHNYVYVGNKILIVSKPHMECIESICHVFSSTKDSIRFRFTIGSADSDTLQYWEPNAPDFNERLESLKYAFNAGYATSVSCEPMLDDKVDQVIYKVFPYVTETILLEKPNRLIERLSMNGFKNDQSVMNQAHKLMGLFSDEYILNLYERYQANPKIMWKDSIKKVFKRYKID